MQSDDAGSALALAALLPAGCRVVSWRDVHDTLEWRELLACWAASFEPTGSPSDVSRSPLLTSLDLFIDWWVMTQAQGLAISNSTFSFTAAMFSSGAGAVASTADTSSGYTSSGSKPFQAAPLPRFWRPVPEAGALEPFDPWDAKPLLTCSAEAAILHGLRGGYT